MSRIDKSMRGAAASNFFRAASEDLRSAELLNQGALYRLAIYHLQQATEKTLKAYLLAQSTLDVRRLRTHNSVLLFAEFLEWVLNEYGPMLEFFKQVQVFIPAIPPEQTSGLDPLDARQKIRRLRQYADKPVELRQHFSSYLEEGHQPTLDGFMTLVQQLVNGEVKDKMENVLSGVRGALGSVLSGLLDDNALESSRVQFQGALAVTGLLPLCGVFLLHDQDPRYPPLAEPPETNWELYTEATPMVGAIPTLVRLVRGVHGHIGNMIEGFKLTTPSSQENP